MHNLKKFPLILLLLTFALPGAVQASALTTGVPDSLGSSSTNEIISMRMWMIRGWIDSGIPLSLQITLTELQANGDTVVLHDSTRLLNEIDPTIFDEEKSEVLVEIDIDPDTDPVLTGSSVDACAQLLLTKGNGTVVPFGEEQCRLFDGF